jgi:hypothetical protein
LLHIITKKFLTILKSTASIMETLITY